MWNGIMYDIEYKNKFELKNGTGKVKEYNNEGKLLFEGEYLNGKKWKGKRMEYSLLGILVLENEYLNGEKNGKGKEYDGYRLIYDGEYLNGKRNGKGKEYYDIRDIYNLKENKNIE